MTSTTADQAPVAQAPSAPRTFVDTNILVYAHDASEPRKHLIAKTLLRELWESGTGVVSTQILQEFYVVATRKLNPPISRETARKIVALYAEWRPVRADLSLILAASRLEETQTLSFWDAQVIESARRAGAARLVTEDLQHGRDFDGVRIEDPFQ